MKKSIKLFLLIAAIAAVFVFVGCGNNETTDAGGGTQGTGTTTQPTPTPAAQQDGGPLGSPSRDGLDANRRFVEPRTITVGLWDRTHERVPEFDQSYWAQWVQREIREEHNIIVEWVPINRWSEDEVQSTLLSGGMAPDIGYTFNNPMVTTFANMGGMLNLYPLIQQYGDLLPNFHDLLSDTIYWNLNPDTLELWSITGRLSQDGRVNTFVREDWLNTLGIAEPTTMQEFEDMLIAFRDNADVLLGADANRMIPFMLGHDTGWGGSLIFESFIPHNITERDWYVHGFDDRRFMFADAAREGTRILNSWFHQGLVWQDFFLHPPGDPMGDDQKRLGYVGAFIANWDVPFRAADEIIVMMRENIGPEANFIVVTPFPNDAGQIVKPMPQPTDRFIFFPHTNTEPLASLLYLDWISRQEVRNFLQFGYEGVHHTVHPNGAIQVLGETDTHSWPDDQFMPSLRNFDITMTVNGIVMEDPAIVAATLAFGYPGIAPEAIMAARSAGLDHAWRARQVIIRDIAAEEGMGVPLREQRDMILHQMIASVSPADFDASWNAMYGQYLAMGGQAIIDERNQAWVERFGDVDTMP